jgi:hypothetical protein
MRMVSKMVSVPVGIFFYIHITEYTSLQNQNLHKLYTLIAAKNSQVYMGYCKFLGGQWSLKPHKHTVCQQFLWGQCGDIMGAAEIISNQQAKALDTTITDHRVQRFNQFYKVCFRLSVLILVAMIFAIAAMAIFVIVMIAATALIS